MSTSKWIFILRAGLGLGFLFAGVEKVLLGFSAAGFLTKATGGTWLTTNGINPTKDLWVSLGSNPSIVSIINFLVVFGEVAIGVALVLGLATRFAGAMGVLMMALFYVAQMSFGNGPFNNQFYYGLISLVIVGVGAGAYALDTAVAKAAIVQKVPALKIALG